MLKALAILTALVFGAAVYVAIQDEYAARQAEQQGGHPPKATVSANAQDNHPQENAENAEGNLPRWYRFFAWPDGVTAWAIILTLLAIVLQTSESARATRAMRDSVRIQEAEFLQWVDIENWEIKPISPGNWTRSRMGREIQNKPETVDVEIRFEIANNTPRPLTIDVVFGDVQVLGRAQKVSFGVRERGNLGPKENYPVTFILELTGEEVASYILEEMRFDMVVIVEYDNALGKRHAKTFQRTAFCGWRDSVVGSMRHEAKET